MVLTGGDARGYLKGLVRRECKDGVLECSEKNMKPVKLQGRAELFLTGIFRKELREAENFGLEFHEILWFGIITTCRNSY